MKPGFEALFARLADRLSDPAALSRAVPTRSDDAEWEREAAGPLVAAAVLVPIVLHPPGFGAGPGVLLTLRSERLSSHAGQVAFPGGRIERGETAEAAALREAAEEVGLDPRLPRLMGRLPDHLTGTGYRVTPVLAVLEPPLTLMPDPGEVQEVFELPLATVLDPAAAVRQRAEHRGRMREFWTLPHERHRVWGATAAILVNLARVLRD